jgi:hypothetical protein
MDISVSRLLHFVESVGLLHKLIQGLHKGSEMVDVHGTLWCPPYFYFILFYSILFYVLPQSKKWRHTNINNR